MASTSANSAQMREVTNLIETQGLRDQLFGTREYTHGARYQLPRKIPLRIEPKTYFGASVFFTETQSMPRVFEHCAWVYCSQ
jgi:hypothetical protein